MNRHKRGFTIIEVSLFIALSGLLMLGLIIGTGASINRQRYEDSVKDVAEYFRTAYSEVLNVSSSRLPNSEENAGRSNKAIYGKLIVIGDTDASPSSIYSYSVIGEAVSSAELSKMGTNNVLGILRELNAGVFTESRDPTSSVAAYEVSEHIIPWEAIIQKPDQSDDETMKAIILIVRSPVSGTIRTYHLVDGSSTYYGYNEVLDTGPTSEISKLQTLLKESPTPFIENEPLIMCIKSDDTSSGKRRAIQINAFASGSSAVNILPLDEDNPCNS